MRPFNNAVRDLKMMIFSRLFDGRLARTAFLVAIVGAALGCSSIAPAQEVSTKNEHLADGIDVCVYRSAKTPTKNALTVLLIPGGGWLSCDAGAVKVYGEYLARTGFVAVSTTYRVVPPYPRPASLKPDDKRYATWPAQIDDTQTAVYWLREHAVELGIDPNNVASMGFSAGGMLSAHLACSDKKDPSGKWSCKVQRAITVGGPWDLKDVLVAFRSKRTKDPYTDPNSLGITMTLFGGTPESLVDGSCPSVAQAWEASPQKWISEDISPILILHGTKDKLVPTFQATRAHERIESLAKGRSILKLFDVGHEVTAEFYPPLIEFLQAMKK